MALLINKVDKKVLKQRLQEEKIIRKTISFYRYVNIKNPELIRDELYKQLNDLLLSVSSLSVSGQKEKVREDFENWKGNVQQIDDVCVIGIKIV